MWTRKSFVTLLSVVLLMLSSACNSASTPTSTGPIHWSYEGEEGPAHWADLSPDFAVCAQGQHQSPIDVANPSPEDAANIAFHYQPSKVNILNNGHTIQVNYDPGSYIEVDGARYDLAQFHFHAPSEHSVDGQLAEAELHLVHRSQAGDLAVVGVMLEAGDENAAFAPVMANLPASESPAQTLDATVNAAELLPAVQTTYRYDGSLTTPPCTEGVKWFLMTQPVALSEAQLTAFTDIFEGNNRPVQPLQQREVIEDTSE